MFPSGVLLPVFQFFEGLPALLADVGPRSLVRPHVPLVMALPYKFLSALAAVELETALVSRYVRTQGPFGLEGLRTVVAPDLRRSVRIRFLGLRGTTGIFIQKQHLFQKEIVLLVCLVLRSFALRQGRLHLQHVHRVLLHVLLQLFFILGAGPAKDTHVPSCYLLVGAHMNLQLVLAGVLLLAMRTAVRLPTGLPRVFHPRLLPISIRILSSLVSHLLPRLFLSHLVTSYVALQIVRPGERSTVSRAARVRASFRLVVPQTSIAARG